MFNKLLLVRRTDLSSLRNRFKYSEYLQYLKYVQYNVPIGELLNLIDYGPYDKLIREYNLNTAAFNQPHSVVEIIRLFSTNIESWLKFGKSFVFYGANGSGKTMTAIYMLCKVIESGRNGYYFSFKEFLKLYNEVYFSFNSTSDDKAFLDYLFNTDFLVLDEIGKESSVTQNVAGALEALLKYRRANNLSTLLIGNLYFDLKDRSDSQSFYVRYGNSVYDLLYGVYLVFQFEKGGRFRQKQEIIL